MSSQDRKPSVHLTLIAGHRLTVLPTATQEVYSTTSDRPSVPTSSMGPLAGAGGGTARPHDLIFLNDGFVLQGRVIREGITEINPGTREAVFIPKGHFMLDGPHGSS